MKHLTDGRALRFVTFGALYFAQGLPWGFVSVGYVVFLTRQGLSNAEVGAAVGLAYLPWSFKIFWGPLLDRFSGSRFGRRRPYILVAQALMGLTLLSLLFPTPSGTGLTVITALIFLNNVFASLQDVAIDAMAVDLLPRDERGTANSIMWAAKSAGVAVGGGAGTIFAKAFGYPALFIALAMIIWAVMLLPLFIRERPVGDPRGASLPRLSLQELKRSLSFSAPLVGLLIGLLTPLGYGLLIAVLPRMMVADLKLPEETVGTLQGMVDPVAGVIGALVGGLLADRIGPRRAMGSWMVVIAGTLAAFALLQSQWSSLSFLFVWVALNAFAVNAYNAASFGLFMTLSNPAVGATQFALYMASTNLCYTLASPLGGKVADSLGYPAVFGIGAALMVVTVGLLPLCRVQDAEARFRPGPPVPIEH